jgi:hypothetical protein
MSLARITAGGRAGALSNETPCPRRHRVNVVIRSMRLTWPLFLPAGAVRGRRLARGRRKTLGESAKAVTEGQRRSVVGARPAALLVKVE